MPCRKENYIFLEQSVTVDSKEVDALVTKIGEALQLHNNNNNNGGHHHHHHQKSIQPIGGNTAAMRIQTRGHGCCLRLRSRGSSRASPYSIPGSNDGDQDWDQIRPWNNKKKKKRLEEEEEDDDPHRLLQELILSGNLIKEAVRRLQFTAGSDCVVAAADNVSC